MKTPSPNIVDLRRKSTLTFDCYGTLVDWERGIVDAFRSIIGQRATGTSDSELLDAFLEIDWRLIAGPFRPYSDILATAAREVLSRLGIRIGKEDETAFVHSVPSWPLFPETLPSLKRLSKRFRLAIISNIDDYLIEGTLKSLHVPFSTVVTSEQARCYKPSAGIFQVALGELGESPDKIVHVAEGLCEAAPARQLGMGSVWVRRSTRSDDGSGATPHLTVPNLTTLVDVAESRQSGL